MKICSKKFLIFFFTNLFCTCTIFSNTFKDEESAKHEAYQIQRGFNLRKNKKQKHLNIKMTFLKIS